LHEVTDGRAGQEVVVGMDIGKFEIMAVARWPDRSFARPWRVANPSDVPVLIGLLKELAQGRHLQLAMEPSGTYGDALRQALSDAGFALQRVSPKAAHDYAEIFDGVPSQHDGKDAAVVAELAAIGKSKAWEYPPNADWDQETRYWVESLDWQQRVLTMCLGQLEALLARHWPEATRVLPVSRGTMLRVLANYGGPKPLTDDAEATRLIRRWGGKYLQAEKATALLASAAATVGMRQSTWELRRLRELASQALVARLEVSRCRRRLQALAQQNAVVRAQAKVIGSATACVL